MDPDNDLHCAPAPVAATPAEPSVKTESVGPNGRARKTVAVAGLLALALIVGIGAKLLNDRFGGVSTSVETASSDGTVASPTGSDAVPAECVGDIADPQRKWYCEEFLPFARKAAADHGRIDRLEAKLKDARDPGVPNSLWIVVIFIGLLTAFNTVTILKKKPAPPPG